MIHQPSKRILQMKDSATFAMSARAHELADQGQDIIVLSVGEPDFPAPNFIRAAAKEAIDHDHDHYTPVPGYRALRQAIAHKFERDNGLRYHPDQIVVSTGAKQSLMNVCLAVLNRDDEAIIPAPYWVSYLEMVHFAEAVPVIVPCPLENDFKITAEQLEQALSNKSRLFIFSSPCNPSGSIYTREELAALAAVLARHPRVVIVSDEIYEHINYQGVHQSMGQFSEIADRVVTINGLSKAFAMTGWRIGYMGAPRWIADACTKLQGQFTSCPNAIAQCAAIKALETSPDKIRYMVDTFKRRLDLVMKLVGEIGDFDTKVPDGAFYILPDVSKCFGKRYGDHYIANASDLSRYLLESAGVATVSGEVFGAPKCLRISFAASEKQISEALKRIKAALC